MKTDEQIQQDVMDELRWQPFLNASEIGVSVKNGVVTLSGIVNSYAKKVAAERAAKSIKGVRAVAEDIVVHVQPSSEKSDSELAAAILTALKWHTDIEEEDIKIKVEDGFVTLEGRVQWGYERDVVSEAIENITGVNGIFNNIVVTPVAKPENVKAKIQAAFERNALIDAERIRVEISGDHVVLNGNVNSGFEKQIAEQAAWMAPGVKSVENHLGITTKSFAL